MQWAIYHLVLVCRHRQMLAARCLAGCTNTASMEHPMKGYVVGRDHRTSNKCRQAGKQQRVLILAPSPYAQHDAGDGHQAVVSSQNSRPQPVAALAIVLVLIAPERDFHDIASQVHGGPKIVEAEAAGGNMASKSADCYYVSCITALPGLVGGLLTLHVSAVAWEKRL